MLLFIATIVGFSISIAVIGAMLSVVLGLSVRRSSRPSGAPSRGARSRPVWHLGPLPRRAARVPTRPGTSTRVPAQPRAAPPVPGRSVLAAHAVLLLQGRPQREPRRARHFGAAGARILRREDRIEVRRRPAGVPPVRPAARDVHDPAHEHRPDVRHDLRDVRPQRRDHRPDPVLRSRHGRHPVRDRADGDRAALFSPPVHRLSAEEIVAVEDAEFEPPFGARRPA